MGGTRDWRHALLAGVVVLAVGAVMAMPPIPQDLAYHEFADQRTILGIPNFWNVASNLPFLLAGLYGLWLARVLPAPLPRPAAVVLAAGIAAVSLGSGWYHLAPDNASLAWDRLPMTVAFMALLSLVASDRVSPDWGKRLMWPLLLAGVASVAWWQLGEARGAGDLRPYALVQFLSMLLIAVMLLLYPSRQLPAAPLWWALALYALAKLAEHFDAAVFAGLGGVSGHSIKHLLAALAAGLIVHAVGHWGLPRPAR